MKRYPFVRRVIILSVFAFTGLGFLFACGGGGGTAGGEAAAGARLYGANCALCHGRDGAGKPALGKDLRNNEFIAAMTDEQAIEFLEEGRRADHPLNDKGVDMPPKGGNPGLSDEDLRQIVVYIRSLS